MERCLKEVTIWLGCRKWWAITKGTPDLKAHLIFVLLWTQRNSTDCDELIGLRKGQVICWTLYKKINQQEDIVWEETLTFVKWQKIAKS